MYSAHVNYLPLAPLFFLLLVGAFLALVALIEIGILRYAYLRLGVSPRAATLLLFGSLLGSYINIPILSCRRNSAQRRRSSCSMACVISRRSWSTGRERSWR